MTLMREPKSELSEPCASQYGATLTREEFRKDVLAGLSRPAKTLPCKYLYDERGAQLFEAICELQEYYPTRTEIGILRQNITEIAALLGSGCHLVDLGSGSGLKTRLLLEHLERPASCTPVDVAERQLVESSRRLAEDFPGLSVRPVCADYTNGFQLPHLPADSQRTLVFFPGSTIGNFEPEEARHFLRKLIEVCGSRVGLLLGVDLRKDPEILEAAYNDSAGVTAQFNLNLLLRANRELGAGFNLSEFRHEAVYDSRAGRIEMHLVSRQSQRVAIGGQGFSFAAGESIVTEHSYKYGLDQFHRLAAEAGFRLVRCWTDEAHWFSVNYLKAAGEPRLTGGGPKAGPSARREHRPR
jgi:dimethylhistidine N-methyltransferase